MAPLAEAASTRIDAHSYRNALSSEREGEDMVTPRDAGDRIAHHILTGLYLHVCWGNPIYHTPM